MYVIVCISQLPKLIQSLHLSSVACAKSFALPAAVIFSLVASMKLCARFAKKPRRCAGPKAKACSKETTSGKETPLKALVQR